MILALLSFASILGAIVLLLRFIYDYHVINDQVTINLFRVIPLIKIPLPEIDSVSLISWLEASFLIGALRMGNRLSSRCVVIHRSDHLLCQVIITPRDPDEFVLKIRMRIETLNSNYRSL